MTFNSNSLNFPNLTVKASPISADILLLYDTVGKVVGQTTIGDVLLKNNNYLGQLNASNGFASTTILSGYNQYQILMGNSGASPGIYTTGSNQIEIGFQLYIGGSYITTGYSSLGYGDNTSNQSVISKTDSLEDSSIIAPAFTTAPILFDLTAIFLNTANLQILRFQTLFNDANAGVSYYVTGVSTNSNSTAATGLKLFIGGSGAITAGSTSYFSIFGIPNA